VPLIPEVTFPPICAFEGRPLGTATSANSVFPQMLTEALENYKPATRCVAAGAFDSIVVRRQNNR